MWSGGATTTNTAQALTLFVTNIPRDVGLESITQIFADDPGVVNIRPVAGTGQKRMVFVDYSSIQAATMGLRTHQDQKFRATDASGLKIDFDKDKRTKRNWALDRPQHSNIAAFNKFVGTGRTHAKGIFKRKTHRTREREAFQHERAEERAKLSKERLQKQLSGASAKKAKKTPLPSVKMIEETPGVVSSAEQERELAKQGTNEVTSGPRLVTYDSSDDSDEEAEDSEAEDSDDGNSELESSESEGREQ
eukprot:gnl/MRDRNA2_/MRDRNA2_72599_c0_seq1.p1 gnl/MRDRNA2_/MRDRNA2_72599_c0~~gnl/MRDRNA2_/MRDRNA2_72599_c0_seq1.p1  ORF type:complete len:249 (+),score=68.28 gnl/MRDRNA2_/MRDRNA2_72599_c0_seq1:107-853(+)